MPHAKMLPDKRCEVCGGIFNRVRFSGRLEDATVYGKRRHCSRSCANTRKHPSLAGYRKRATAHRGSRCERCGAVSRLHAHHRNGDVTDNRPENIETVCAACHISGHWADKRALRLLGVTA